MLYFYFFSLPNFAHELVAGDIVMTAEQLIFFSALLSLTVSIAAYAGQAPNKKLVATIDNSNPNVIDIYQGASTSGIQRERSWMIGALTSFRDPAITRARLELVFGQQPSALRRTNQEPKN
jgi:hypothetical protein